MTRSLLVIAALLRLVSCGRPSKIGTAVLRSDSDHHDDLGRGVTSMLEAHANQSEDASLLVRKPEAAKEGYLDLFVARYMVRRDDPEEMRRKLEKMKKCLETMQGMTHVLDNVLHDGAADKMLKKTSVVMKECGSLYYNVVWKGEPAATRSSLVSPYACAEFCFFKNISHWSFILPELDEDNSTCTCVNAGLRRVEEEVDDRKQEVITNDYTFAGRSCYAKASEAKRYIPVCSEVLSRLDIAEQTATQNAWKMTLFVFFLQICCSGSRWLQVFILYLNVIKRQGLFAKFFLLLIDATAAYSSTIWVDVFHIPEKAVPVLNAITVLTEVILLAIVMTGGKVHQWFAHLKHFGEKRKEQFWARGDCLITAALGMSIMMADYFPEYRILYGALAGPMYCFFAMVAFFNVMSHRTLAMLKLLAGLTFALFQTFCSFIHHQKLELDELESSLQGLDDKRNQPTKDIVLLFFVSAMIHLPGVLYDLTVCCRRNVEHVVGDGVSEGRFASSKFTMGQGSIAAIGLEEALGLTKDQIDQGIKDGVEAIFKEIRESGSADDLENFTYIVNGGSFPSAVQRSLETGQYHGGSIGPDDFDTGHAGMPLKDWMEMEETKLAHLSEVEMAAARFYTSSSFWRFTKPMRSLASEDPEKREKHPWPLTVYFLDRAVKKLRAVTAQLDPTGFAKQTVLWRGMKNLTLDICEFDMYGGTELAPMSTTTDEEVARKYADSNVPLVFKYEVVGLRTGVPIQWLSLYPMEVEYLYPPLTYMTYKRHYEDDGQVVVVVEPAMSG